MKGLNIYMIENVLNKRDNENEFEHHKRLVYGKLKDKTLSDYDYGEMSKYLYGKELASDETRKRMYGSCQTLEILDKVGIDSITDGDILSELEAKKIDIQKEKQRFFDQRREFNKLVNSEGRMEHLFEVLSESAKNLSESSHELLLRTEPAQVEYGEDEFVLVLSDWHYGMVTDNAWNKYDTQICRNRISALLQETIARITKHGCRRGHIVLLGDFIHGGIRVSTRVASEELVCDQLMQAAEILAQFIEVLSQYVEHIDVYSTFGNHARTIAKKEDNMHMDNLERIIPWWLSERVAAGDTSNITIHNDNTHEFILFEACGHGFCASHGDLDKVKGAARTLAPMFFKLYDFDVEYILLGDQHHIESFEEFGIESMLCGSLCGTDEYANTKRLYSNPSQLLLIVNKKYGADARYQIQCK